MLFNVYAILQMHSVYGYISEIMLNGVFGVLFYFSSWKSLFVQVAFHVFIWALSSILETFLRGLLILVVCCYLRPMSVKLLRSSCSTVKLPTRELVPQEEPVSILSLAPQTGYRSLPLPALVVED